MNERNVQKIMDFVKWDGPLDAPIRFLTIEDGGDHEINFSDRNEFFNSFGAKNEHTRRPHIAGEGGGSVGKPAEFIAKLMTLLKGKALKDHRDYLHNELYTKNEANVKFYPISRANIKEWPPELSKPEYLGLEKKEYEKRCRNKRPEIIASKLYDLGADNEYIILGARKEWLKCMEFVFNKAGRSIDFKNPETKRAEKGNNIFYQFYYDMNGEYAFSYYSIFTHGPGDSTIEEFAEKLLKCSSLDSLNERTGRV